MSYFTYKAINLDGTMISGVTEAEDINAVYDDLTAKSLNVLAVKRASNIIIKIRNYFVIGKVKRSDVIEYVRNLAVMLRAGIPLLSAIEDSMESTDNRHLKSALADIKSQVELGTSFSEALARHKGAFPDIFI
ncbi:MAG: type II secretion system F family protein, partial [Proteobacteria bacterium]|nr:type II secretion system F family protein [Pseudomonadota bacterium]